MAPGKENALRQHEAGRPAEHDRRELGHAMDGEPAEEIDREIAVPMEGDEGAQRQPLIGREQRRRHAAGDAEAEGQDAHGGVVLEEEGRHAGDRLGEARPRGRRSPRSAAPSGCSPVPAPPPFPPARRRRTRIHRRRSARNRPPGRPAGRRRRAGYASARCGRRPEIRAGRNRRRTARCRSAARRRRERRGSTDSPDRGAGCDPARCCGRPRARIEPSGRAAAGAAAPRPKAPGGSARSTSLMKPSSSRQPASRPLRNSLERRMSRGGARRHRRACISRGSPLRHDAHMSPLCLIRR